MTNEMKTEGTSVGGKGRWVAAVVMIAATYGYFLIFAEFGFLELLRARMGDAGLRPAMGALGAGGVAGSLLAAWRFDAARYARALRIGAAGCAVSAALACFYAGVATAGAIGLSLGWLTVSLAAGLRAAAGARRLGLAAGLGTGAAYALCNVPRVFEASAREQAAAGVVFMALAFAAAGWLRADESQAATSRDFYGRRAGGWVAVFLALVWMDSAAFYIIQHTEALRAGTWGGDGRLWLNACIHLGVAVAAGAALDRERMGSVTLGAWAALAAGCVLLGDEMRLWAGAEIFYTAGVSLYSVALVFYPARGGRPWLAGIVFAAAGWLGSALGIGMAQDLHAVPAWFLAAAGAVVLGVLLARWRARAVTTTVVLAVAAGCVTESRASSLLQSDQAALIARGREVFIGEGCIHCHSQFVRPGTDDVLLWGPEMPLAESLKGAPPLLGNRRQGPDLAQVGNRRSPEWNRLHLIAPRVVSPGSRMPSYAHLFREGDGRGEALVAYLASLGAGTEEARAAQVAAWRPAAGAEGDATQGARLFAMLCTGCHGAEGRGDGVLAKGLSVRPPDWRAGERRRATDEETAARIIKFGLPGSPMAGHEYLKDDEVVSLARFVRSLHDGAKSP